MCHIVTMDLLPKQTQNLSIQSQIHCVNQCHLRVYQPKKSKTNKISGRLWIYDFSLLIDWFIYFWIQNKKNAFQNTNRSRTVALVNVAFATTTTANWALLLYLDGVVAEKKPVRFECDRFICHCFFTLELYGRALHKLKQAIVASHNSQCVPSTQFRVSCFTTLFHRSLVRIVGHFSIEIKRIVTYIVR